MAYVRIIASNSLRRAVTYITSPEKTEDQLLVSTNICTQKYAVEDMLATKRRYGKTDGIQCFHLIQSFAPGEVTPEQAMEIAQVMVQAHFADYECVMAVHVDKNHVHAHTVINSVNWETGKKYVSNWRTLQQFRETSDRLCREHGLSVIKPAGHAGMHYYEWLRNQRGYSTYRSMLEADMDEAIGMATDIGEYYSLMEQMGYEIRHGNRTSYSFQGSEYICPERRDPKYSEENIRRAIDGAMMKNPEYQVHIPRQVYQPPKHHPKRKGFIALYYHYLYLLGRIQKRVYPPRVTPELMKAVQRFEEYREQFRFLQANGIETESQMRDFMKQTESELSSLMKKRTILNVRKKKRMDLYRALAEEQSLKPAADLYRSGHMDFKAEYDRYAGVVALLDACGESREVLADEKATVYKEAADLNREIRRRRKDLNMCEEIQANASTVERQIAEAEQAPVWERQYEQER